MSLHHFFLDDQVIASETSDVFALALTSDDLKHARVLRLEPGEHISVVDADLDYFECEIVAIDKDEVTVRIAQKLDMPHGGPRVVVVQGVAKGDKMDMIVRHATEVGISGFIPLMCERSVVKLDSKKAQMRRDRWQSIAKSASMQSGRLSVPVVGMPLGVKDAACALADMDAVIVCWEESQGGTIHDAVSQVLMCTQKSQDEITIAVVIGPEGGLSAKEVRLFTEQTHAHVVTLGSTILRTETAGIVAPSLVIYECGGLGNSVTEE